MAEVIKIKKGLDISLQGKAEKVVLQLPLSETFAVKPTEYIGLTPRLAVKVGDTVLAGTTLFSDKYNPEIRFASPVSGTVELVNRGERRKLFDIVIKTDGKVSYEDFGAGKPSAMSAEDIKSKMLASGVWPLILKRPFGVVPQPSDAPKAIFITGFDSAPLAPDYEFVAQGEFQAFQTGVDALKKLTSGSVHLGVKYGAESMFAKASGLTVTQYDGPHPAGNAGTHINKLAPINKGESVWTINALDVIVIGRLFLTGHYDVTRTIAVTGPMASKPQYIKTIAGESVKNMLADNPVSSNIRIVLGNALTGEQVGHTEYLGLKTTQVTLLEEGAKMEFLGWAAPGLNKFSVSRTFFSWLMPNKEYALNTNTNGGLRPFVVTGQYEKVFPLDIMPVQLLKSIIIEDIDLMESLGIYEVVEEDFALCEFVCTSKIEAQSIIRKGLDTLYKELS